MSVRWPSSIRQDVTNADKDVDERNACALTTGRTVNWCNQHENRIKDPQNIKIE